MNWKGEAVEKLRKYEAMCRSLQNIPLEVKRLEVDARAIRGARTDGTPVKGGGSGREDALLNNLAHRQELSWALEQAKYWVEITRSGLETLTPEEKLVLQRFYLSPERGSVERLCMELGVEHSSVYRKRDKALHKFALALYGQDLGS
ncbi:MAG TPA: hypothetical protein IAB74_06710 [Candidatus Faecousia excrementigallinarum]|uniref:Uncharacterized protein n=1 Tax=Candidatus Faecousia excrementigallinarum TaxID=2840806 RepID=A0A9D1CLW9_9FIRM|nr:hypothetical protein [Candidatus Faecousia excrementigallinarum]